MNVKTTGTLSEASRTYGKMHDQIIKLQRMILSKLKKTQP